jgi:hypothetical protein
MSECTERSEGRERVREDGSAWPSVSVGTDRLDG